MHTTPASVVPSRRSRPRKAFLIGFTVGFLVTVPVVVLALLLPVFERMAPVLTPGAALLRPLSSAMAAWPGGINMLLASMSNGFVFGLVAYAAVGLLGRHRARHRANRRNNVRGVEGGHA